MTSTGKKLREAKYFLNQLRTNVRNKTLAGYYLSAFLSSARSVLWVMRAEYSAKKGWEKWFQKKDLPIYQQRILEKITELRNIAVKVKPLETQTSMKIRIAKKSITAELKAYLKAYGGQLHKMYLRRVSGKADRMTKVQDEEVSIPVEAFDPILLVNELPDDDVVKFCTTYIKIIGGVVKECAMLF